MVAYHGVILTVSDIGMKDQKGRIKGNEKYINRDDLILIKSSFIKDKPVGFFTFPIYGKGEQLIS